MPKKSKNTGKKVKVKPKKGTLTELELRLSKRLKELVTSTDKKIVGN